MPESMHIRYAVCLLESFVTIMKFHTVSTEYYLIQKLCVFFQTSKIVLKAALENSDTIRNNIQ